MIELNEYIYLFEAKFQPNEYNKHNYKYRDTLISDILSGKEIKLGSSSNSTDTWKCDDIEKAKKLFDEYPEKVEEFNAKMKELNGPKFSEVFKGVYSGFDKEGQSDGELAESLVCYLYNHSNLDKDFDEFCKLANYKLSDIWKLSSIKTVKLMYGEWPKKDGYVAIHVDGNNKDKIDKKITDIALLFKSKKDASRIVHNSVDDMYAGSKKDKWNPADIILVNKEKLTDIYDVLDNEIGNGQALNAFLVSCLKEKSIIPISLKQVGKSGSIGTNNVKDDEAPVSFKDFHINFGKDFKENTVVGSIILIATDETGQERKIQSRSQTSKINNISIEAKASATARLGKGISTVKNALNIDKGNSYYVEVNTINELKKKFKEFDIEVSLDDSLDDVKPAIGTRPCISGLLGLLTEYKKQEKDYTPENFFKFLWISCTKCPGSYYIIH